MVRKGYNSDWAWKQWAAEMRACADAIKAGKLNEADAALTRAQELDGQLELWDDGAFPYQIERTQPER